jgi:hypothetical protein
MNTMDDLHREVQKRLHESLDGKEIDMEEGPLPRVPHMLGITSLGAIHTRHAEKGTLLDPRHQFWDEYEEDVNAPSEVERKIETAIRSLKADGLFSITYPHGEDSDLVYCEAEPIEREEPSTTLQTTCPKCDTELYPSPLLDLHTHSGHIKVSVDCGECDFAADYETTLERQ